MLNRFLEFGTEHSLFKVRGKILLAISGGLDSMVMLDLFVKSKLAIAVAHCNFGLRGKESDDDSEFVKNYCKKNKIVFHTKKFKTEAFSRKKNISIQVAARELRYSWFNELIESKSYQSVATAHHLDDSIETFFINLLRGTGIKGLSGIPVKGEKLIRPLSPFTRKQVLDYATKEKIKWREDSSNSSEDYFRNKIRHTLIPQLLKLQPQFPEVMMKNMEYLRQTSGIQKEFTRKLTEKFLEKTDEGAWKINTKLLNKEPDPGLCLHLILQSLGVRSTDIESLLKTEDSGKQFLSGEFRLLRDRNSILVRKGKNDTVQSLTISGMDEDIDLESMKIEFKRSKIKGKPIFFGESDIHQFDADKLKFPLELRPWIAGDFFYPLGMKQAKKVSDFLIDKKVNRFEKEKCLVLLSGTNIVCILGHRIDDRYKISDKTKNIFSITINKN
jgi:tRNA(Ile)-lysidine synthase